MVGPEVVDNMARSFESTRGKPLADRILDAMDAGLAGGGDRRGQQSAAMFIVKKLAGAGGYSDVSEDLRVNDHPAPLTELRRLLTVRRSGEIIATANKLFESGQRDQGLQQVLALRDRIPENDAPWIALANMYLKMGRKADALGAIRRAVELNPANKRKGSGGLPGNKSFDALHSDPEWVRIMGS
jgi:predicted Zn-dependent protease